jgi:RNA polymerase sigma factor (sigma-70 family)
MVDCVRAKEGSRDFGGVPAPTFASDANSRGGITYRCALGDGSRQRRPFAMDEPIDAVRADEDERNLMRRVSAGDRAAFDLVYRRYADRVRAFLSRVLPLRALVDEALNDAMLAVWRRSSRYDGSCRLSTWIFAIAQRKALHALRHARVRARLAASELPARKEPDAEAQVSQLKERLRHALARLPLEQLTVLELTYFEGYANREVASLMRCPVETVKTRMFHARRKLRRMFSVTRGKSPLHQRLVAAVVAASVTPPDPSAAAADNAARHKSRAAIPLRRP